MSVQYEEIGCFRSPFTDIKGMPIQPVGGTDIEGQIELLPQYQEGLMDLEGFSHIIILSHLHRLTGTNLL